MILNRRTGGIQHRRFFELADCLSDGDVVVLNNTKVIPAKIRGNKEKTGGKIEFLLVRQTEKNSWEVLARPGRNLSPGTVIAFSNPALKAVVRGKNASGRLEVEFITEKGVSELLKKQGEMPLPHYIKREKPVQRDFLDYQTVYAREEGAVAAPTAGLHFTGELLEKIKSRACVVEITLHVGPGTFQPVRTDNVERHRMEKEFYRIDLPAAEAIEKSKRTVAVGTTTVRALETAGNSGVVRAGSGWTELFIYPGFKFRVVDALVTNFHLPRSTLFMMVCAFAGRELIRAAYSEAIRMKYGFFSYGDAMAII